MKITLKDVIQIVISLGLGVLVFYFVYKGLNMEEVKSVLHTARLEYLIVPVLLCLLSSVVRALRWNMLLEPLDKKPKLRNTLCAVLYGYFINHLVPRAGEIARCGIVKKYEKIPFTQIVGTVITERACDVLVTGVFVLSTIALEYESFRNVLQQIYVIDKFMAMLLRPTIWIVFLCIMLIVFLTKRWWIKLSIVERIKQMIIGVWNGFKSVTKVKNKPLFIFYSFLIFFIYFIQLYFTFFVFDFTSNLTINCALVTYVFGTFGMMIPVQAGIGTYEYTTILALQIYNIGGAQAGAFALISHMIEIVVNCTTGFISPIILPFISKKEESTKEDNTDNNEE